MVGGLVAGVGIFATSLGPSYPFLLAIWCIGSFFAEFIYNTTVTTANKWFPDMRGVAAGLIAGAFSWGSLPFIFPIRAIAKTAPDAEFFHIIYIMAAIIGGVTIVTSLFMKDPPAGMAHSEILFVLSAILALFFWGRLFSLFPAIIGHYFGEAAAGSNYGTVYAIAKGSGGFYGGVLWAVLISEHGFPFAMGVAGVMAIVAGLLIVPLKYRPPVWRQAADAMPAL